MKQWRVVLPDEFVAAAERIAFDLQQHLQQASDLASRPAAEEAYSRFVEFEHFVQALVDLATGQSDPAKVLKHHGRTEQGTPFYVLTDGPWQASFLVDEARSICTASSIVKVSPSREYIKNFFRGSLR